MDTFIDLNRRALEYGTGGSMLGYYESRSPDEIIALVADLKPRTVVFDVEPLIAYWDTEQKVLDAGLLHFVENYQKIPAVEAIAFATNSRRKPSTLPSLSNKTVLYQASAMKPFRLKPLCDLPKPGVLVGDQIATDGILAHRLGYSFIRYRPHQQPLGPFLMGLMGYPLQRVLFRK